MLKNFYFLTTTRPVMGSAQPPIQRLLGALSPRVNDLGLKLTTHLKLLPRLRKLDLYIRLHSVVLD
jgi:hypothetical protein